MLKHTTSYYNFINNILFKVYNICNDPYTIEKWSYLCYIYCVVHRRQETMLKYLKQTFIV